MNYVTPKNSLSEPMWERLTPKQFERFCFVLINAMRFEQAELRSGPGDEGEDITAFLPAVLPSIPRISRKWVFQCKRTKRITRLIINEELSYFAGEEIDSWVLITTTNPSPQFRRWFEKLNKSKKWHFYILAWWRMDLNILVREHHSFLVQNLPPDIIERLQILKYLKYSTPTVLTSVIAKCKYFTDSQVNRFARSKYIRGLYVPRKLQSFLGDFHNTEAQLAKKLKADLTDVITNQKIKLTKFLESLTLLKSNINELPSHSRPFEAISLVNKFYNSCKTISNSLNNLLQIAYAFSEISLLNQQSHHILMINAINATNTLIKQKSRVKIFNNNLTFDTAFEELQKILNKLLLRSKKEISASLRRVRADLNPLGAMEFSHLNSQLKNLVYKLKNALSNCVVVVDRAGGGKTSLLCELALNMSSETPVILFFGKENYQTSESIIEKIQEIISEALGPIENDPIDVLDEVMEQSGLFLNIFIDGINENRKISEFDLAILGFLEWSKSHRIRLTITCRDIYWDFFDYEKWKEFIYVIRQNEMYQFSLEEYNKALPLYLKHFRIKCELAESAFEACRHPLLLRFFCEAYGDPEGSVQELGKRRDIRLKELFDEYYACKLGQIRVFLRHKNIDMVSRFLLDLASHLYENTANSLLTSEIEKATGYSDISTQDSMYLRFLDEDIIIEEDPTEHIDVRRVYFVYEEFMEYVLALYFYNEVFKIRNKDISDIFAELKEIVEDWINARGVVEYITLMLLGSREEKEVKEGYELLKKLILSKGIWIKAFWSIVGKVPEKILDSRLFDLFYPALCQTEHEIEVKDALLAMSRYDEKAGESLAIAMLWTATLPNVLRWEEIERLPYMSRTELRELADRLEEVKQKNEKYDYLEIVQFNHLLRWITPLIKPEISHKIHRSIKRMGEPARAHFIHLMFIIRDLFPEQQLYLINGIFHSSRRVASFCADRIRFVKRGRKQIAFLCDRLAQIERNKSIRNILLDSVRWLNTKR